MPKIDLDTVPVFTGTGYPPPYAGAVSGRSRKRIGDAGGLTQYGVNICTLKPGAASAQRHWHLNEDEFVYILSGEAFLVEDCGEVLLKAGDAAAFPAGAANGHHLVNRSGAVTVFLEVGSRAATETVEYTDPSVDMRAVKGENGWRYERKDGRVW
ncbi:MAG: cupin domain-containing protein [Pseudomonadota bacterium]